MKPAKPLGIMAGVALAVHDRLLAAHGGAAGLRDAGLLESALALRQHSQSGSPNIIELAALYTAGLVRNHAFVDGNKRTGFAIGIVFLELNGFTFHAPEEDATQAVFALAAGKLDEAGYAAFLRSSVKRRRR